MSSLSDKLRYCEQAMNWLYNNCDENSEFFEAVSDAWLFFNQAKRAIEALNLLDESSKGAEAPPDTH